MVVTMLTFMVLGGISMGKKGGGGKPPKDEGPPPDPNPAIAYEASSKKGTVGKSIMVSNEDGTNQILIVEGETSKDFSFDFVQPSWSPDGSQLVFFAYDNIPVGRGLYTVDIGPNGEATNVLPIVPTLSTSSFPEWNRDSNVIAYSDRIQIKAGIKSDIYLVNLDDSPPMGSALTNTPARSELYPTWRNDGTQLAAVTLPTTEECVYDVVVFDLNIDNEIVGETSLICGDPTAPLANATRINNISWAKTKDVIAVSALVYGNWDIWCIDLNGNQNNLTNSTDFAETSPSWSPNDHRIIYRKGLSLAILTLTPAEFSDECPSPGTTITETEIVFAEGKTLKVENPDWKR